MRLGLLRKLSPETFLPALPLALKPLHGAKAPLACEEALPVSVVLASFQPRAPLGAAIPCLSQTWAAGRIRAASWFQLGLLRI